MPDVAAAYSGEPIIQPSSVGGEWLERAALAAMTPADLVQRCVAIRDLLMQHAEEAERLRKPVDEVWKAIRRTGVFYHFVPKRFGGLEFDVPTFVDTMLPLAEGCASTGWVTAFCVEHNWMLAQFPERAQQEIFDAQPYIIAPGVTNPPGRAVRAPGGFRVSGRWRWGTGVMHADWVLATAQIDDGTPDRPQVRFFAMPIGDVKVIDTWHVDGMCGTGSHDIAADDVFVPEHFCTDMALMRDGRGHGARLYDNPIYRIPMLPFLAMTATIPAVGTSRAALRVFRERLTERVAYGTDLKYADKVPAQIRLARAEARIDTAELIVRRAADTIQSMGERSTAHDVDERIHLRMGLAYAMELCREAMREICEGSGASAHHLKNPLQRAARDVAVMSSHVVFDLDAAAELRGRSLLGLPPNSPLT